MSVDISDRLKKIRFANDLTQTEFGEKIGKKLRTVQEYESGVRKIDTTLAKLICYEFGINREWLISGDGEMYNNINNDNVLPFQKDEAQILEGIVLTVQEKLQQADKELPPKIKAELISSLYSKQTSDNKENLGKLEDIIMEIDSALKKVDKELPSQVYAALVKNIYNNCKSMKNKEIVDVVTATIKMII